MRRHVYLGLLLLVVAPAGAGAQVPGVVLDPESPTAKEYAIPLEAARRAADPRGAPGRAQGEAAAQAAPLFGAGVAPASGAGGEATGGEAGSTSGSGRTADTEQGEGRRSGRIRGNSPLEVATARPGAPDGGSSLLLLVGAGIATLLVGVAAGLALRARRD